MSTRILLLPGGTSVGSVALAHAGLHKIVELYDERLADPHHRAPHTVVVLRDPAQVPPATLRGAAITPADAFPDLAAQITQDPHFFDGIDLVVETSGSTTGRPQRVGLSIEAIIASIDATHDALDGPGVWILALPAHHIAGAMALLRSTRHDLPPRIVDTSAGFTPQSLLPAIRGALSTGTPAYVSLVPAQLSSCLEDAEVTAALATLNAVLVGGQHVSDTLIEAARTAGIRLHTSYGMSETCGGIAYDGQPLGGTRVRVTDPDEEGVGRLAITGPTLMTRYLDADAPWVGDDGTPWVGEGPRWLLTNDLGSVSPDGTLTVVGRADDVIISGGKNITPTSIESALRSHPRVTDACVVGIPHDTWGHTIGAVLVTTDPLAPPTLAPCDEATAAELRDHVATTLGRHATPRILATTSALPFLPSGKIDRRACAQRLSAAAAAAAWVR